MSEQRWVKSWVYLQEAEETGASHVRKRRTPETCEGLDASDEVTSCSDFTALPFWNLFQVLTAVFYGGGSAWFWVYKWKRSDSDCNLLCIFSIFHVLEPVAQKCFSYSLAFLLIWPFLMCLKFFISFSNFCFQLRQLPNRSETKWNCSVLLLR